MKISTDPIFQWFQARIIHRILPTRKYLALCKITDSSICVFCENSTETLNHMFWNCNHVREFWNNILKLLHENCQHCSRFNLCQEIVLFGVANNVFTDDAIDSLILYAKFFIYKCKLQSLKPQINIFSNELRHRIHVEKVIAYKKGKIHQFTDKWKLCNDFLEKFVGTELN